MKTITISTKRNDQILDITEVIETHLREAPHEDGLCSIFVSHTTCALTTADLDRLSGAIPDDSVADATQSTRWKAYVGHVLQQRAGSFAAQTYRDRAVPNDAALPGSDPNHVQLGLLSLVVRNRAQPIGYVHQAVTCAGGHSHLVMPGI